MKKPTTAETIQSLMTLMETTVDRLSKLPPLSIPILTNPDTEPVVPIDPISLPTDLIAPPVITSKRSVPIQTLRAVHQESSPPMPFPTNRTWVDVNPTADSTTSAPTPAPVSSIPDPKMESDLAEPKLEMISDASLAEKVKAREAKIQSQLKNEGVSI